MNKIIFVTYASGIFKGNVKSNLFFAKLFLRASKLIVLSDLDLKQEQIYHKNKSIFDEAIGGGYWAWKPWTILKAMNEAEKGDIVIYQDCGKGLKYKNFRFPKNIIKHVEKHGAMPGIFVPIHGNNKKWTHEKCFKIMNCESNIYYNSPQVEASISAWKVNNRNIQFIKEWLNYCLNIEVIGNKYTSDNQLIPHRYDQSILTNLVIKNSLRPLESKFNEMHITKSISLVDLSLSNKFQDKAFLSFILQFIKIKRLFRKILGYS
tara:strand:- start:1508 stop:2296 length:789 start_codon:yes stop_codon:yes gene_type:complete